MGRTIAIIGGTGALGTGFARRWADAGHKVVIGSRTQERADAAAAEAGHGAVGLVNPEAAAAADIVVLTVPYAHHGSTIESIADGLEGKILVDATVPLMPPRVGTVQLPEAGSAAVEAQAWRANARPWSRPSRMSRRRICKPTTRSTATCWWPATSWRRARP